MGHPLGVNVLETLTGHRTLTQAEVDDNNIFTFDPDGAKNLILPAEANNTGIVLYIHNAASGAEIITIQDDTPATVCTPTENETAVVWCDGVSWRGLVGAAS
jgi:hypothetical protein